MEDFIGIGIADPVEQSGVGQRALERVRLSRQRRMKLLRGRAEHVQATGIVCGERALTPNNVERRSMLRARFGEEQHTVGEVERGEPRPAGDGRAGGLPVQPAGDHQVQHDEIFVRERQDDPFAEAADVADRAPGQVRDRWIRGAEQERARDPEALERRAHHPWPERVEVQGDVRQLGH